VAEETVKGVRDDGSKIEVSAPSDTGTTSKTGAELMQEGKTPESPTPSVSMSKFGDPNAPSAMTAPEGFGKARFNPRTGMPETGFYGHLTADKFKKTSIIGTTGRVR